MEVNGSPSINFYRVLAPLSALLCNRLWNVEERNEQATLLMYCISKSLPLVVLADAAKLFVQQRSHTLQQEPALARRGHVLPATEGRCDVKLQYYLSAGLIHVGMQDKCAVCEGCSLKLRGWVVCFLTQQEKLQRLQLENCPWCWKHGKNEKGNSKTYWCWKSSSSVEQVSTSGNMIHMM